MEDRWCCEEIKIMSDSFVGIINRLFTASLLVALLIACQEMPQTKNFGFQLSGQQIQE
jgi:uncharacterized lipoprotein YehR (DUF1307 family)